ncbi:MAG: GIY-YIG nuclease family protein [Nanoarchaeota archaeon]
MKGTYILVIEIDKPIAVNVGSLGKIEFRENNYCYIGSGMNSLDKRIERHLTDKKKTHWHIDYLLKNKNANITNVYYRDNNKKEECKVARRISKNNKPVRNFGCSDCKCESHLFKIEESKKEIIDSLKGKWKEYTIKEGPNNN